MVGWRRLESAPFANLLLIGRSRTVHNEPKFETITFQEVVLERRLADQLLPRLL